MKKPLTAQEFLYYVVSILMERVTQTEIARLVGVTQRAVAAVVGTVDSEKVRVSEATRLRILSVAKDLGYRPQRHAQLLRGVRSGTIGIIKDVTMHQHSVELVYHLSVRAHEAGYTLLTQDLLWSGAKEVSRLVEIMVDARVEAVLILTEKSDIDITLLRKAGIPVIAIGVPAPDGVLYIAPDFRKGMRELVIHLHEVGHRQFAYTCPMAEGASPDLLNWNIRERIAGVLEGIRSVGLSRDAIRFIYRQPSVPLFDYFQEGYRVGCEWEEPFPDAILCYKDHAAFGLFKAFSDRGIAIPQDVAITGFNNASMAAYCQVPITSVAIPTLRMSDLAWEYTSAVIQDQEAINNLPQETLLPCQVIPRASSGGPMEEILSLIPELESKASLSLQST